MSDLPPPTEKGSEPPPAPRDGDRFRNHLLRALPVIIGVALLTSILSHCGFLQPFETAALDSYLRLKPALRSENVVIVGIDECDYLELFDSTSPLDPDVLSRVLAAVAAGRPRLIAVDLDTAHEHFRSVRLPEGSAPLVWARDAIAPGTGVDCPAATNDRAANSSGKLAPAAVLGRSPNATMHSGLAVLPRDADGVVRRYYRNVDTSEGLMATFPWAVVRLDRGNHDAGRDREAFVLNFAGDRFAFPRISAGDVLRVAHSDAWTTSGPLRGKVVLLGGFYRAARDEYVTPVGPMSGVELVAQAIESELTGGGIRPANELTMVVLELLGGIFLVWIHHRLGIGAALALSVLTMPLLSIAFSYLAFASAALWANFIPILASVLVHQLYDHGRAYRTLYLHALKE